MILVIGKPNCGTCNMVKSILNSKGIEYEYKLLGDLESETADKYINMAKEASKLMFPIIVKEDKIIAMEDIQCI